MHELPITEELLKKVVVAAGNKRVNVVKICLGELTGFVDESIQFYWQIVAQNSVAADAKVIVERIVGKMQCLKCGHKIESKERTDKCPKCGSFRLVIVGGDELILSSIEVEADE